MQKMMSQFFSNASYATWAQSVIIVVSVVVAIVTLRHTDQSVAVTNSLLFTQKYFLEKPSPSAASLALRTKQFEAVQEAKTKIPSYDEATDRKNGWEAAIALARPEVAQRIESDANLKSDYETGFDFFIAFFMCVETNACDRRTAVEMLAEEAQGFYNATCPYMEYLESKYKHDEETPRFLDFLVGVANFRDLNTDYFCREKVKVYLSKQSVPH